MFITTSHFQQLLPSPLYGRHERGWTAVALSTSYPWFLFTFYVVQDGERLRETMAIAWESVLIPVIKSVPPDQRVAVALVLEDDMRPETWTLRQVDQLWLPSEAERDETGLLLLRLEGEKVLRNVFMSTFEFAGAGGRTLLYDGAGLKRV